MTDANINLSDCSTQRAESPLSKRPRKQQQPKKIVSTTEIQVVRRSPKRRRKIQPIDYVSQLRDKHISRLIMRKGLRCFWCRSWSEVFPYHTISSLLLHKIWHHRKDKFGCEHCSVRYRHRYKVVLHSSRAHLPRLPREQITNRPTSDCQISVEINSHNHKNMFSDSVPVIDSTSPGIVPPISILPEAASRDNNSASGIPTSIMGTSTSTIDEEEIKIPNFLTTLQDFQTNQLVFRPPDLYNNEKSPQDPVSKSGKTSISNKSELKSYQLYDKIDETTRNLSSIDGINIENKADTNRTVDTISSVGSTPLLQINHKTSVDNLNPSENSQITNIMATSTMGPSNESMPLIIPSYPPSG